MKRLVSAIIATIMLMSIMVFPTFASGIIADLSHNSYWSTVSSKTTTDRNFLGISKGTQTTVKISKYGDTAVALYTSVPIISPTYHTKGNAILSTECGWEAEVVYKTAWGMNNELGMSIGYSEVEATVKQTKSRNRTWEISLSVAKKYSIDSTVIDKDAPTGYYAVFMGEPVNLYCYQKTVTKTKNGALVSCKANNAYLPVPNSQTSIYIAYSSDHQATWELY